MTPKRPKTPVTPDKITAITKEAMRVAFEAGGDETHAIVLLNMSIAAIISGCVAQAEHGRVVDTVAAHLRAHVDAVGGLTRSTH